MFLNRKKYLFVLLMAAGLFSSGGVKGNSLSGDSLSLNSIISEVVHNHPMVKRR
jgi:hypothetical protein